MIAPERHVMLTLGRLFEQARELVISDSAIALRPSQLRVLSMVPRDGITVTDLADRVGMTKQGVGQFVAPMLEDGHLIVEVQPDDRRVRLVRRTELGQQACDELSRVLADLESQWAQRIGAERYRQFRAVLDMLAGFPAD